MSTKLLTTRQFAFRVGAAERLTLAASEPFAAAYAAADADGRAALRLEWAIGYIAGREGVSETRAAKIWAAGKGSDAIDAGACNRASVSFAHHVVRPKAPSNKAGEGKARVRLPAGTVERLCAVYAGLTREQIIAAHKRALESLSFE